MCVLCNIDKTLEEEDIMTDFIYFLQEPLKNYIKIGTTKHLVDRRKNLVASNIHVDSLTPLLVKIGDIKLERAIHRRFKKFKAKGEWFHPEKELLDYIKSHYLELKEGTSVKDYCGTVLITKHSKLAGTFGYYDDDYEDEDTGKEQAMVFTKGLGNYNTVFLDYDSFILLDETKIYEKRKG